MLKDQPGRQQSAILQDAGARRAGRARTAARIPSGDGLEDSGSGVGGGPLTEKPLSYKGLDPQTCSPTGPRANKAAASTSAAEVRSGKAVTHLTSTCQRRGRVGPAALPSPRGARELAGDPIQPPGLPLGGPGPEPTPTGGLVRSAPALQQCAPRVRAVLGGNHLHAKTASPRCPNPVHSGETPLTLAGPQEETPRFPRLRLAAEGAGPTYRGWRPFSAGSPKGGAEEPTCTRLVEPWAAAARRRAETVEEAPRRSPSRRGSRTLGGLGGGSSARGGGATGGLLARGAWPVRAGPMRAGSRGRPSAHGGGAKGGGPLLGRPGRRVLGARGRGQGRTLSA